MSGRPERTLRTVGIGLGAIALGFFVGSLGRSAADREPGPGPGAMDAAEMEAAMTRALLEPDIRDRTLAMDALLAVLDEGNTAGAARAIDPIVIALDPCDLGAYVNQRARFDPRGALEQALSWKNEKKREAGVNAASLVWALDGSPVEARAHIETIESEQARVSALGGLVRGWAQSGDTAGITRFLMQLPDDPNQMRNNFFITFLTATLAREGIDPLIAWFDDIDDDAPNGFKRAAFGSVLTQLASREPERAIEFLDTRADRGYAHDALWRIAIAWQKSDPEAAFDWLLSRPAGADRRSAAVRVLQRWRSRDSEAAARWLRTADLEDEPELRQMLRRISRREAAPARRGPDA